jgi:hypothetical protein
LVLGGEVAVPGGECAPDASIGLEAAGVPWRRRGRDRCRRDRHRRRRRARGRRRRLHRGRRRRLAALLVALGDAILGLAELVGADLVGPGRLGRGLGGRGLGLVGLGRQLRQHRQGERNGQQGRAVNRTHGFPRETWFQAAGSSPLRGGGATLRCAGNLAGDDVVVPERVVLFRPALVDIPGLHRLPRAVTPIVPM